MTLRLLVLLSLLLGSLSLQAAQPVPRTKVLLITGGHGFERDPFLKVFSENPSIEMTHAEHASGTANAYERKDLFDYDAIVLYDMPKEITDAQKARFMGLLERGIGLVVLHHALVSYQHWPDYERIIGGRYPEADGKGGVVSDEVGYKHGVKVSVEILAKDHPVTAGLGNFTIDDEIYWGFRVGADVVPLIGTSQEKSGKILGWHRVEGKSRIVYLQPGHGPEAHANPGFRKLVGQSIQFVARPIAPAAGWAPLFDGKTLGDFDQRGGKAEYRVENGEIVGRSAPNTPNSFLCTKRAYSDFALDLEFKVDDSLNSGVMLRSRAFDQPEEFMWHGKKVKAPAGRVHGMQVEIDPSARAWTGGLYGEGGGGWFNDLKKNEPARNAFKKGDWNKLQIECRGDTFKTWLNGVPAGGVTDDFPQTGFIGLQVHGVGKKENAMEVRFRNLRILELTRP